MKRNTSFLITSTIHVSLLVGAAMAAMLILSNQTAKKSITLHLTDGTELKGVVDRDLRGNWHVHTAGTEVVIPEDRIAMIDYGHANPSNSGTGARNGL